MDTALFLPPELKETHADMSPLQGLETLSDPQNLGWQYLEISEKLAQGWTQMGARLMLTRVPEPIRNAVNSLGEAFMDLSKAVREHSRAQRKSLMAIGEPLPIHLVPDTSEITHEDAPEFPDEWAIGIDPGCGDTNCVTVIHRVRGFITIIDEPFPDGEAG